MNKDVKINLSPEEAALVKNTEWIFTKQSIISKVYILLGEVSGLLQQEASTHPALPPEILVHAPKIAKGEQYQKLPYVMLDYPRFFGKQDTLALRTFFWWGHHFSVHLLASGCWLEPMRKAVYDQADWLAGENFHLCISKSPWDHRFEEGNYLPFTRWITDGKMPNAGEHGHIKIGRYLPLQQWQEASLFLKESGKLLLSLVKGNQAPSR